MNRQNVVGEYLSQSNKNVKHFMVSTDIVMDGVVNRVVQHGKGLYLLSCTCPSMSDGLKILSNCIQFFPF
jgi:hypothetical protein